METIFHYYVEVRDKKGNYLTDFEGKPIKEDFKHKTHELETEDTELYCDHLFDNYKERYRTNNINIDVRVFNERTETYMLLYSFYGGGEELGSKRFVKHT